MADDKVSARQHAGKDSRGNGFEGASMKMRETPGEHHGLGLAFDSVSSPCGSFATRSSASTRAIGSSRLDGRVWGGGALPCSDGRRLENSWCGLLGDDGAQKARRAGRGGHGGCPGQGARDTCTVRAVRVLARVACVL